MACDFLYNKTSIQNSFVHFTVSCKVLPPWLSVTYT